MPRKRIKFDPDVTVEFTEFGSGNPVFKCRGGYFTHKSYRLMDYFVSHWFEVVCQNWTTKIGGQYIPWTNMGTDQSFSKIFYFRVLGEVKGADGRILERVHPQKNFSAASIAALLLNEYFDHIKNEAGNRSKTERS